MNKKIIIFFILCAMVCIFPAAGVSAAGADVIPNDNNGIPDRVLYQAVLECLKFESVIEKSRQDFTKREAERLDMLSIYNLLSEKKKVTVKTFKGIHYLKNITYLQIKNCDLKKIKGMEPLPKLKNLDLCYNELQDIKFVKNFKNLEELDLTENRVASLAGIGKLKKLNGLIVKYNRLSDIKPLKKCRKLEYLDAYANRIKSLEGIENLSQIHYLYIGNNQIKDLTGIEQLKKLNDLDVSGNRLTSLKGMENLKKIEKLDISDNRLTSLKGIEQMEKLETLYAIGNQLASVDEIAGLKSIRRISVAGNRLSRLPDLRGFDGIDYFSVEFNYLSEQEIRAKFPTAIWSKGAELNYSRKYDKVKSWFDYQIDFQNIDTEIELTEPSSVKQITKDTKKIAGYVHMKDAFIQFWCYYYNDGPAIKETRSDKNGYFEFTDLDLKKWGGRHASICFGMRMDHLKDKKPRYYTTSITKYRFTIKNK